ncbi:J domain-containing protein [Legionella shakespearei]|uniref:Curved DNA binding protein DnaJ n=1 Tax=Legionella shakespearei DSM 23087 TaxID=1122169 RepID=A0A0W0Z7L4_9GAMM|nr:J domain-containing protein [Legionella shakespearei]KTD65105.1 curved DNA binding protein DnaJ [Legionella shakespearei DSM 23087]
MNNLYLLLGLSHDASAQEIKKAYRTLSLIEHPDRGGSSERMGLLNEAYQTLSDPNERRNYDEKWRLFQEADVDDESELVIYERIKAGNALPYSYQFRKQHESLNARYRQTPLTLWEKQATEFQSGKYSFTPSENGSPAQTIHDVFALIRKKTEQGNQPVSTIESRPLTPGLAIKQLMEFLSGDYFGSRLTKLSSYLADEIKKIKQHKKLGAELELYEGFFELTLIACQKAPISTLIYSVNKITNFAKTTDPATLSHTLPLFYDPLFRTLYAQALHLYWQEQHNLDELKSYDGMQDAKDLLMTLKERLSMNGTNKNLTQLIRHVKSLYQYEKTSQRMSQCKQTAEVYREDAFQSLDWVSFLMNQSSRAVLMNHFLQIGLKFQNAARLEDNPTLQMADEQLALKMYLTAIGIAQHDTPDIEMYAITHVLRYLASFKYQDDTLNEVILSLKKRTHLLADMFPFFELPQSNIVFLREERKGLHLMRQVLHTLIKIYQHNKNLSETPQAIHHAPTEILYQAYEACLKNWYQEEYNSNLEQQFRIDLMDELLFENSWTFLDVEERLNSPWIMVDRDAEGWIKPTRMLPYQTGRSTQYRTINGAEINHKTGKIDFYMTPWTEGRPVYEKVFSQFDLEELLEKNIGGAVFSLDPVDPLKPYHPFNAMRFAPSSLAESELLNTMLLTDYMLKFMTTNQEVCGQYPFDQRPVANMLSHVPKYLRQIIEAYQQSQHSGALHRFWIEAEEINLSLSDGQVEPKDITRIRLGNLKMVVKKHRMERDLNGELKDVGNEDEGWPIYVLTAEQFEELKEGRRQINTHAMIFIYNKVQLLYWENNKVIREHTPIDYRETLIELYIHSRDVDGKVPPTTESMPLLYRITKEMAAQTGLSHRYSPEFIFAHEFTEYYDEFAQYLPEFGRLKELSKITVLVRYLNSIRQSNREELEAIDYIIADSHTTSPPNTESYKKYHRLYETCRQQVTEQFDDLRDKVKSTEYGRRYGHKNIAQDIRMQFIESNIKDIEHALEESGQVAAQRVAVARSRRYLQDCRTPKAALEAGFVTVKLGTQAQEVDLKGQCFWVPASVRHEVPQAEQASRSRYSFFIYGGVNVQPKINTKQGNAPLGGSRIGGSAFNNVNAQAAMNHKLRILQSAQLTAVKTEHLADGRIRYYDIERPSRTPGPTRGNAYVTEHNTKTGQVRTWAESYDHQGNVNRVHPKTIDGQNLRAQHYPPTGTEKRGFK